MSIDAPTFLHQTPPRPAEDHLPAVVPGSKLRLTRVIPFALLAIVYLGYALSFPEPPFFGGDAEHYWRLGETFFARGRFHLLDGEPTFRGYLLPLIFGWLRQIAVWTGINAFRPFFVVNGLFTAASLALVVPWLFQRYFRIRPSNIHVIAFGGLFFLFWRGYLLEPLSDTWSLFTILTAIALVIKGEDRSGWKAAGLLFLAGLGLGAAVNIRPIYLICAPLLLVGPVVATWNDRRARPTGDLIASLLAFALGFVLMLFPQAIINHRFLATWNPFVQSGGLYTQQLFFGMSVARHECAYFIDPAGLKVLLKAGHTLLTPAPGGKYLFNMDLNTISLADYIKLVAGNPVDAMAVYVRHVANGFGLLGSNIYYCQPHLPRYALLLLSVLSIWIGIAGITLMRVVAPARQYWLLVAIPFMPMLFIVPTAVEGRFFFAAHLAAYAVLCFFLLSSAGLQTLRRHVLGFAAIVLIGVAVTTSLIGSTFASTYLWLGASQAGVLLQPETVLMQP